MTTMLKLTLQRFDLATDDEKPESYNKEFNRTEVLTATVAVPNMDTLLLILENFLKGNNPHPQFQLPPGAQLGKQL